MELKTKRSKIKNSKIFKVWEASAQVLVVQTVNLTECGELVQDLVSDAKDYDSRSVSVASHLTYCRLSLKMEIKNKKYA